MRVIRSSVSLCVCDSFLCKTQTTSSETDFYIFAMNKKTARPEETTGGGGHWNNGEREKTRKTYSNPGRHNTVQPET